VTSWASKHHNRGEKREEDDKNGSKVEERHNDNINININDKKCAFKGGGCVWT